MTYISAFMSWTPVTELTVAQGPYDKHPRVLPVSWLSDPVLGKSLKVKEISVEDFETQRVNEYHTEIEEKAEQIKQLPHWVAHRLSHLSADELFALIHVELDRYNSSIDYEFSRRLPYSLEELFERHEQGGYYVGYYIARRFNFLTSYLICKLEDAKQDADEQEKSKQEEIRFYTMCDYRLSGYRGRFDDNGHPVSFIENLKYSSPRLSKDDFIAFGIFLIPLLLILYCFISYKD